jgi:hypothetical protein
MASDRAEADMASGSLARPLGDPRRNVGSQVRKPRPARLAQSFRGAFAELRTILDRETTQMVEGLRLIKILAGKNLIAAQEQRRAEAVCSPFGAFNAGLGAP